ncbi:phage replisome organizer N-terminal domain-containing protein [Bacillus nitratireducens]|uniref:phage replisome organizer N-terminal domain-containing protein n=1 Tax=Bacillus nitratireducens TaxID=2026193 RepID=UPI000BF4E40B|nr:phage replisome organizer N-terminal domain-containing protein [Bacillus nitratireducens]MED0902472.1 phage replisome organizer N-terminal domain-containing protein [Bacillus nitratireducens]PFS13022.1 replication protein [Bacillus cereus]
MSEVKVKWIKLSTTMFEDEKIRLIESMPEADTLLIIWIKLLAQAGKTNASGYIFLNENIPYTEDMLATLFNRSLNTVRMALSVFQKFGMIDIDENHYINVINWGKHQNLDRLEKIKEDTRKRVAAHRERKKQQTLGCNVTCNDGVTDIDKDLDKDLDKDIKKEYSPEKSQDNAQSIPYQDIVDYLNMKANTNYKHTSKKTQDLIKARWKEGFGLTHFQQVIDIKTSQWIDNREMSGYLRPITLFGTKFESYLNEKPLQRKGTFKGGPTNASDQKDSSFIDKYDFNKR